MSLARALGEVLSGLEAGRGQAVWGYDAVAAWDADALDALVAAGLLQPASAAQSIECHGCEERCFMDVVVQPVTTGAVRAFVVCDVPGIQEVMGRVAVAPERLQQWRSSSLLLAQFLVAKLGLDSKPETPLGAKPIPLGMLKSEKGRRWASLLQKPLLLEVNQQQMPLAELLFVEDDEVVLDWPRIEHLLANDPAPAGKAYASNTDKREARKLATQAMRQNWQDAYERLHRDNPDKSKRWCSQKIARTGIGCGKDSETIRKQLK